MVVGSMAYRRKDLSGQRLRGDLACARTDRGDRRPGERAIACESELAPGRQLRSLIDDAADCRGKAWVAHPVENDLSNCALTVEPLGRCFIIDSLCETFDGAGATVLVGLDTEFGRRTIGRRVERQDE